VQLSRSCPFNAADVDYDPTGRNRRCRQMRGNSLRSVPRNHEVFAWCLDNGLKLVMQMTLMSIGLYNEPAGAWLPSILF
jgi:hypothetical protein